MYSIEYYETANGRKPAKEFILSQDMKMQAKIFSVLDILEAFGPDTREPYTKYLRDGIFEIRAKQGSNISRVLYFFIEGKQIILTNGFVKKTQSTPQAEIDRAKRYKNDYTSREG